MASDDFERVRDYHNRSPALTVKWCDSEGTGAVGWLVINSLRNGAAGGGTRMKTYDDENAAEREAIFLAKTMEVKFKVAGPDIGGAKSVIKFDPESDDKSDVLKRWLWHITPLLQSCYGTGGDQNVTMETIDKLTRKVARVQHPQEGIVRGYPNITNHAKAIDFLRKGLAAPIATGSSVSLEDDVTGFGLYKAIEAYYAKLGQSLAGKRVSIEGLGCVGATAATYLHEAGAKVVAVLTESQQEGIFALQTESEGLDVAALRRSMLSTTQLPKETATLVPDKTLFWSQSADVFVPASSSFTVTTAALDCLQSAGVKVIACGSNDPFADDPGCTDVQEYADRQFAILPDFIANCGLAKAFSMLMQAHTQPDPEQVFADVSSTIQGALAGVLDEAHDQSSGLLAAAYRIYLTPEEDSGSRPPWPSR